MIFKVVSIIFPHITDFQDFAYSVSIWEFIFIVELRQVYKQSNKVPKLIKNTVINETVMIFIKNKYICIFFKGCKSSGSLLKIATRNNSYDFSLAS